MFYDGSARHERPQPWLRQAPQGVAKKTWERPGFFL